MIALTFVVSLNFLLSFFSTFFTASLSLLAACAYALDKEYDKQLALPEVKLMSNATLFNTLMTTMGNNCQAPIF